MNDANTNDRHKEAKDKIWIQILLGIFILWLLGVANPYWCVYPICWIQ